MSTRAAPFHCPYCGDEDLRPLEAQPRGEGAVPGTAWECHACNRAFALSFLGLLASGLRPGTGEEGDLTP